MNNRLQGEGRSFIVRNNTVQKTPELSHEEREHYKFLANGIRPLPLNSASTTPKAVRMNGNINLILCIIVFVKNNTSSTKWDIWWNSEESGFDPLPYQVRCFDMARITVLLEPR